MKPEQKEMSITMVKGLLAFEEITHYKLRAIPDNPYFFWFEADGGPGFLLTRPEYFFNDYRVEINSEKLAGLNAEKHEPRIYSIVTVPERLVEMTANLMAPLFINEQDGLAMQIVLENTPYLTRHYLYPPEKRLNCG